MIQYNLNHIIHKYSDLLIGPLVFVLLTLLGINTLSAQRPHCHADELLHSHFESKGLKHELNAYKQSLQNIVTTRDAGVTLTSPVVVHIIHAGESIGNGSNLSASKVLEQIDILNNDFNQLNSDQNQIPSEFAGLASNVEMEFCLAQTDPTGQPSSGITRTQFGSISSVNFIENNIKPQTQWDPARYMNIWIVRLPNPDILGYAYLPTPSIINTELDGVVISHLKIGNQGSTTKGRTLVHEIGHYFGLPHLWGFNEDDCNEDDQVSDTPFVRTPYYGHPVYPQFSCGTSDMFMNYMDYVDDNCMFMFTEGQRTIMRSVANNQRVTLLNSNVTACNATVSTDITPEQNDLVKIFPNPCYDDLTLTIPDNQIFKEVSIFDSSGKMIDFQSFIDTTISTTQQIDTQSLENGMYILRIETTSGEAYAKRFVKLAN